MKVFIFLIRCHWKKTWQELFLYNDKSNQCMKSEWYIYFNYLFSTLLCLNMLTFMNESHYSHHYYLCLTGNRTCATTYMLLTELWLNNRAYREHKYKYYKYIVLTEIHISQLQLPINPALVPSLSKIFQSLIGIFFNTL